MNRTTGAQRANARYDKIWAQYEAQKKESETTDGFTNTRYTPEAKAYELATRRIEMTHTPGPWRIDHEAIMGDDGNSVAIICDVGADNIGTVIDWPRTDGPTDSDAVNDANARLIAAAPALLEKAERFLEIIENMTTDDFSKGAERLEREALRNAIASARGETVKT